MATVRWANIMLKWSYHTFREMRISEERKGHLQEISLNLQVMAMSKYTYVLTRILYIHKIWAQNYVRKRGAVRDYNRKGVSVDGSFRRKMLITTLTPYVLWTNAEVDVRGEMAPHSRWRTARWMMLLSEHLYPQSLCNYPSVYTMHCIPAAFSPDLTDAG